MVDFKIQYDTDGSIFNRKTIREYMSSSSVPKYDYEVTYEIHRTFMTNIILNKKIDDAWKPVALYGSRLSSAIIIEHQDDREYIRQFLNKDSRHLQVLDIEAAFVCSKYGLDNFKANDTISGWDVYLLRYKSTFVGEEYNENYLRHGLLEEDF